MAKGRSVREGRPLLDIASYGRRGPSNQRGLSRSEIELIRLTVSRAPEVMVKVSGGGRSAGAVRAHLSYIGRHGDLEIETDDGERLAGRHVAGELVDDWDLDLEAPVTRAKGPKLVHNLVFSMPARTPAEKLFAAVRAFAREEFALKNRYAMVLHTDQGHPHVHLVVKASGEGCDRLNIRKETLRRWRQEFARMLRAHGIKANATERAVRGVERATWLDGIYRADLRGASTFMRKRESSVREALRKGVAPIDRGKSTVLQTRRDVETGWLALAEWENRIGVGGMGDDIRRFVSQMAAACTDVERVANRLRTLERESPGLTR